jgi:hypothetical protein
MLLLERPSVFLATQMYFLKSSGLVFRMISEVINRKLFNLFSMIFTSGDDTITSTEEKQF